MDVPKIMCALLKDPCLVGVKISRKFLILTVPDQIVIGTMIKAKKTDRLVVDQIGFMVVGLNFWKLPAIVVFGGN